MKVLGLDVSTAITGIALVADVPTLSHIRLEHVSFEKCKTIWEKADLFETTLKNLLQQSDFSSIDRLIIEDPAKRFQTGKSSINTLMTLVRFNGLVSMIARSLLNMDPIYISASHARKLCGMKMLPKKKAGGLSQKQQAFNWMSTHDLKEITWPKKKRSENIVDYAYDIVDAYVVAKSGITYNGE